MDLIQLIESDTGRELAVEPDDADDYLARGYELAEKKKAPSTKKKAPSKDESDES